MTAFKAGPRLRRVGALALISALGLMMSAIPATAADSGRPLASVLEVSLLFDRDVYDPGATMHLTVILTSRADHELTGITVDCGNQPDQPNLRGGPGWGPLAPGAVPDLWQEIVHILDTYRIEVLS